MKASTENSIPDLTLKQERALVALLSSGTLKEAAQACGSSEVTLWRWLQQPEVQARYRTMRRQSVEAAIALLQSGCRAAARVLLEVAEDTTASATARVAAAKTILDQSLSALELGDLAARIEQLEKQSNEPQPPTAVGATRSRAS